MWGALIKVISFPLIWLDSGVKRLASVLGLNLLSCHSRGGGGGGGGGGVLLALERRASVFLPVEESLILYQQYVSKQVHFYDMEGDLGMPHYEE